MRPAIVSGMVTGDAPVSYWLISSLPLVTVPEVFADIAVSSLSPVFPGVVTENRKY